MYGFEKYIKEKYTEISLLRKSIPFCQYFMRQNREDPYRIKVTVFLCIKNQKGPLFMYNYLTIKYTKEGVLNEKLTLKNY